MKSFSVIPYSLAFIFLLLMVGVGLTQDAPAYRVVTDIAYKNTGNSAHLLDIYLPQDAESFPTIIYITGGMENSDGKADAADLGEVFASRGIVLVAPNRSSNFEADLDANADEIAASIAWTHHNIELYGGDASRIVIMSLSAGARPATLAVLNPVYLSTYDDDMSAIAGMIIMGGLLEIEANHATLNLIPDRSAETVAYFSPINYVTEDMPPVLMINGDEEVESILEFTREFVDTVNAVGGQAEWVLLEGNHAGIRYQIGRTTDETSPIIADWLISIGISNFTLN